MTSSTQSRIALVTGGGRGIGANVARALAEDGWSVVVAARTRAQVDEVAAEIGGRALEVDVASWGSVVDAVAEAGPVELLVNNAGIGGTDEPTWELDPADWWRVFEVNTLGAYHLCRATIPGMIERGSGRIVDVASGAAYLPGGTMTAYAASKAALHRFSETLARELEPYGIPVFSISPGLVRTEMTEAMGFDTDAPWTPPEAAPALVRRLATGRYDALAGRYLHAEHDDLDDLLARIDEVREQDLNAIRLRR
jgi:NAD(P)-dependent dehydrogenase (short-subunit alcohol dehydrogenase family)